MKDDGVLYGMMKVAVCDEDAYTVGQIKKILDYEEGVDGCDGYTGLPLLWNTMKAGERYQLIIMAIEWAGRAEGIEAAIRIQSMDADVRIIYMTAYPLRYIQQIFLQTTGLSGFLIKPVEEELLLRYIEGFMGGKKREVGDGLLVKNKRGIISVRFREILYLESERHLITIWTKTDRHSCYGRLEKLLEQLPESFVQCHKSYIVNMKEINQIERTGIRMEGGTIVPVSKSRYSTTRSRYLRYMEELAR